MKTYQLIVNTIAIYRYQNVLNEESVWYFHQMFLNYLIR